MGEALSVFIHLFIYLFILFYYFPRQCTFLDTTTTVPVLAKRLMSNCSPYVQLSILKAVKLTTYKIREEKAKLKAADQDEKLSVTAETRILRVESVTAC